MMQLAEDEQPVWAGRRAWSYFLGSILLAVLLLIGSIAVLVQPGRLWEKSPLVGAAALGALLVAALVFLRIWVQRLTCRYAVTTQRAFVERGLLSRHVSEIELANVRDIQLHQSALERVFGVGTLEISSAGRDTAEVVFSGIPRPDAVKEYVRQGVRAGEQQAG